MTTTLRRAVGAVVLAALAPGCSGPPAPPPPPSDDAGVISCDGSGQSAMHASAEGRWLLGLASRYPADTALTAQADAIHRSQRARRAAAWAAVARVLAPVPLAHQTSVPDATVPRFRTWYDREDVTRTFQQLYAGLGPDGRAAQARFSDAALDAAFGWNVDFATTLPEWPASRLAGYASAITDGLGVAGVAGVQRILVSPDGVRHLVSSYPEVLRCIANGAPTEFVDGPAAPQQLAREPVALPACGERAVGPFFVASGGQLTARIADPTAQGAQLTVREGVAPNATARCTATSPEAGCTVTGPGTFVVRVAANGRAASGMLDVQYAPPTPELAGCLHGVFPPAAATVALEWRRTDLGFLFPIYDTSAAALARRLAPGADATWGPGDGSSDPDERHAYTMRTSAGSTFRLAAMHIRTRELDHWLNITLWWSYNPDEDFGADRPDAVRALGGPWSQYKMCVATDFDELDPDPAGGFAQDAPSLAAALRAVYEGQGGPSWCSNPYIDAAPGLVRSNCVGCHQHAMSGVRPAMVQNDITHYPQNGRMQVRNNFPSDGFWGLDGGDQLASVFNATVDWYSSMP